MKGNKRRPKQERSHPTTTPWSGTRFRRHAYADMTITQRYQALFNWIASWQQNDGTRSYMMTRDWPGRSARRAGTSASNTTCSYARSARCPAAIAPAYTPEAIAAKTKEAE